MEVNCEGQRQIQAELDEVAEQMVELEALVGQLGDSTIPETVANLETAWAREM